MNKKCPNCGATIAPAEKKCPSCGTSAPSLTNIYCLAGAILALIIALLCVITNFVDSATIFNRMYTTIIEWNIPLATIALIVIGFVVSRRENQPQLINIVSVVLLVVAFLFSNTTKNKVQDHVSNFENYVEIAAEAMKDNAENVVEWRDDIEEAAKDIEHEFEAEAERKMKAEEEKYRESREYSAYDDEYYN